MNKFDPYGFHIFSQQFSCVGSPRPPLTCSQHLTNHSTILPNGTVRTIQHVSVVNIAAISAKNVHPNPPLVRAFSNQGTSLNFQTGQSWVSERRSHQHTPPGRSDPIPPDSWFFFEPKNTKQNSKEWKFHAHLIVFFMDCHFVILCTWTPHLATIVTSHICHFVLKHQDTSHRQRPPAHQINGYLFFFHQISNTTVWFTHGRIMTRSFQKK